METIERQCTLFARPASLVGARPRQGPAWVRAIRDETGS